MGTIVPMKLSAYLDEHKETYASFGPKVGLSAFGVGKLARGERRPRPATMQRIIDATGGAVTPNDFFDQATPANDTAPTPSEDAA